MKLRMLVLVRCHVVVILNIYVGPRQHNNVYLSLYQWLLVGIFSHLKLQLSLSIQQMALRCEPQTGMLNILAGFKQHKKVCASSKR